MNYMPYSTFTIVSNFSCISESCLSDSSNDIVSKNVAFLISIAELNSFSKVFKDSSVGIIIGISLASPVVQLQRSLQNKL